MKKKYTNETTYNWKEILHTKGNNQQTEKQPRELYKTSDNPVSLVRQEYSKYIRNLHISKAKKKKLIINQLKTENDLNRQFFLKRDSNGQQVSEKVLKITNYQGNESQNHDRLPTPVRMNII